MNARLLKGLCVGFGLLCFAADPFAQDNATVSVDQKSRAVGEFKKQMAFVLDSAKLSPDQVSRAQDDIANMDEPELRSLAVALTDCSPVRSMTSAQSLACHSTLGKYQADYGRARAVDGLLYMLLFASAGGSGGSTTLSFHFSEATRGVTIEDMTRALEEMLKTSTRPALTFADVEEALRRKVTETIKSKIDSR